MILHVWKRFEPRLLAEVKQVTPIGYTIEDKLNPMTGNMEPTQVPVYPDPEAPWEVIGNGSEADFEAWKVAQNWSPTEPPRPIPAVVTCATLRIAIKRLFNITEDMVDAVIAGISDANAKWEAETLWKKSPTIRRQHPLVLSIGAVFGLSTAQIDQAFVLAETL